MLGWEVVKGKERFFIFRQAFAGFWELDLRDVGSCSRVLRLRRKISLLFGEKSSVCFDSFFPNRPGTISRNNPALHGTRFCPQTLLSYIAHCPQ
jgi:hypothetical protein